MPTPTVLRELLKTVFASVLWAALAWTVAAQTGADDTVRWTAAGLLAGMQLAALVRLVPDQRLRAWLSTAVTSAITLVVWAVIGWVVLRLMGDRVHGAAAALVVAGAVACGFLWRSVVRRLLTPAFVVLLRLWMAGARYGPARVAFWALVGWLLSGPLCTQVQVTHPVVLMGLGLLLGLFGVLAAGVGAGAVLALAGAGPALLWWLVPLVAGACVGFVRAYRQARPGWWRYPAYFAGRTGGEPGPGGRLVDAANVLAGLAPVAAVVATGRPGGLGSLMAAAALTALHWYVYAESGRMTRENRQELRFASTLWVVHLTVLSTGPVGDWFVRAWRDQSLLYTHAVAVALLGAGLLHFLQVAYTATLARALTVFSGPRLRLALGASYGLFPGPALALFLAAGVHHPDERLLEAAQWLIGSAVVLSLFLVRRTGEAQAKLDASIFVHIDPVMRARTLSAWRHDAIVARPGYPDLTLPRTLIREGIGHALGDRSFPPVRLTRSWPQAGRSTWQFRLDEWLIAWIDDAAELLRDADKEARARLSGKHLDQFRAEHTLLRGYCARTLAEVYQMLGFREEAAASFLDAAEIWGQPDNSTLAAACRLEAAMTDYLTPSRAVAALAPLVEDPSVLPMLRRRAIMLTGAFQLRLGDTEAAERSLAEGAAIKVGQGDFSHLGFMESRIQGRSVTFNVRPDHREDHWLLAALDRVSPAALSMLGLEPDDPDAPVSLRGVDLDLKPVSSTPAGHGFAAALGHWHSRRYRRAIKHAVRTARTLEWLGLIQAAFTLYGWFGFALRRVEPRAARAFLMSALDWYEELRVRVTDDDLRIALFEQVGEMYEVAVRLTTIESPGSADTDTDTDADRPAETVAFELTERAKSRVLAELMGSRVPAPRDPAHKKLIGEERRSAHRFAQARERLRTDGARREAVVELRDAQSELTRCWTEMLAHESLAEYAGLRAGAPVGYDDVRRLLRQEKPPTILAEYLVTKESTLLFVCRADLDRPAVVDIPLSRADLHALCSNVFTGPHATRRLRHTRPDTWQDALRPLVAPLADWCAPGDTIWFVPHDELHHVPLHAVRMDERTCVADRHPVRYTPSASTGPHTARKPDPKRDTVLILADGRADRPLIHARQEAAALARLFGHRVRLLVGEVATTRHLTRELTRSARAIDVVHLACHGEFDPEQPMRSGLLLAPDGADDGRLSAADILRLRLPANLVTLSACDTGRNDRRSGDELIGLTRALMYAGASAVVACLWSVDELSTSLVMRGFYQARLSGMNEAAALRQAQLDVRRVTAADVVEYCAQIRSEQRDMAPTLDLDIATARFWARDYRAAAEAFAAVTREQLPGSPVWVRARGGAVQARRAAAHAAGAEVDYDRPMFDHPYFWAPYLVIGGGP
ncbi:CHAT domain-containing protein [Streptomyces sp. NPDC049837]|uniref:CHAT domain-containing protein n=1 Tax=Streptomyces sp. NPDC049837 TaxID=3155277 RepID=UPI00343DFD14